jgi:hypothetical protein
VAVVAIFFEQRRTNVSESEYRYVGERQDGACRVFCVDNGKRRILEPAASLELFNHSPNGFEWGYGGSGPAQLALAICLDAIGDKVQAVHFHQSYKWRVVAKLPHEAWELTRAQVREVIAQIQSDEITRDALRDMRDDQRAV